MMRRNKKNKKQPEPVILPKPEVVWEGDADTRCAFGDIKRMRLSKTWVVREGNVVPNHVWESAKQRDALGVWQWGPLNDAIPESFYEAAFKKEAYRQPRAWNVETMRNLAGVATRKITPIYE